MSCEGLRIVQQCRSAVQAGDDNLEVPIIFEISNGCSPCHTSLRHPRASGTTDLSKRAIVQVVKQKRAFGVRHSKGIVIHLRIDVAVGHEQVLPSIIVEVEELNAETKERDAHGPDPGDSRQVGKLAISVVVIQVVGIVRKIGLYYVGPPVVIVVGGINSHSSPLPPIGTVGHPGTDAHFFETTVAIVMVEKAWG